MSAKKKVDVVGAVIIKDDKVLCGLRSEKMALPLMWEFMGGKIEGKETPEEALTRELKEELNIDVVVGEMVADTVYDYPTIIVHLTTYYATIVNNSKIVPTEHEKVEWIDVAEIEKLNWAPADLPTVDVLLKKYNIKK